MAAARASWGLLAIALLLVAGAQGAPVLPTRALAVTGLRMVAPQSAWTDALPLSILGDNREWGGWGGRHACCFLPASNEVPRRLLLCHSSACSPTPACCASACCSALPRHHCPRARGLLLQCFNSCRCHLLHDDPLFPKRDLVRRPYSVQSLPHSRLPRPHAGAPLSAGPCLPLLAAGLRPPLPCPAGRTPPATS